ncbi:MAG: hypothetical protein IJ512_01455, partial [Ruminococcus sp.]|nr:hypothetical protein [Ruminococcus sp.]
MKTTFKKTMAALSAAAVVAASAAVMAVPADAASGTISAGQITLTLDELKAANYKVTVPLSISGNTGFHQLGFGIKYDSRLTLSGSKRTGILSDYEASVGAGSNVAESFFWGGIAVAPDSITAEQLYCEGDGDFWNLTFTVPETAVEGDTYPLTMAANGLDGTPSVIGGADGQGTPALVDGFIQIKGADTTT